MVGVVIDLIKLSSRDHIVLAKSFQVHAVGTLKAKARTLRAHLDGTAQPNNQT